MMLLYNQVALIVYSVVLAKLGHYTLWGLIKRDSIFPLIVQTRQSGLLPDQTPLRSRWTGIVALDTRLTTAVIFYNGLLNGQDEKHVLLQIALHCGMQATATVLIVEMFRAAEARLDALLVRCCLLGLFGTLNQLYGAAVVYPYTLSLFAAHKAIALCAASISFPYLPLPLWSMTLFMDLDATRTNSVYTLPLLVTAFVNSAAPAALLWPAFSTNFSPMARQLSIAAYRLMPTVVATTMAVTGGFHILLPEVFETLDVWGMSANKRIMHIYATTATYASLARLYCLLKPLIGTSNPDVTISRIFNPQTTIVSAKRKDAIASAAHRFLQWDEPIMALTFIPIIWTITPFSDYVWKKFLMIVVGNALIGPGALLAGAFTVREATNV